MLIFIDESGIHKRDGNSTLAFVYVGFEDEALIEAEVGKIEKSLGISYFHWRDYGSKAGWQIRKKFISAISGLPFTFKIILFSNPVYFTSAFEIALEHLIVEKKIRRIIIDGKKPRRYLQRLKKILRQKGISVKKIRAANDLSAAGLRLADAIAGLFRSRADNPTEDAVGLCGLLEKKKTVQLVGGQITR